MRKAIVGLILLLTLIISVVGVSAASMKIAANKAVVNNEKGAITEEQKAELRAEVPSYEKAEKTVTEIARPRRFLMYTYDGKNIMWGTMGRGYFIGEDNKGKKAWGIYHGGVFAGFYDGDDFFVGKYNRGAWKAENLFGQKYTAGRYVLFPMITATAVSAEPLE